MRIEIINGIDEKIVKVFEQLLMHETAIFSRSDFCILK